MSNRSFAYLCIALIAGLFLVLYSVQIWFPKEVENRVAIEKPVPDDSGHPAKGDQEVREGYVERGGVYRPERDVVERSGNGEYVTPFDFVIGHAPGVDPDTNKSTQLVKSALSNREAGKHLTPFSNIEPFDRESFEANPEQYLAIVEPARIWQALPPAKDVSKIRRTGQYFQTVLQGERVHLKARTEAHMPVTFYSSKLGQFENGLSNITVQANADGEAEAWYQTTTGQYGDIDLIASSPVRSGYARYLVRVNIPEGGNVHTP